MLNAQNDKKVSFSDNGKRGKFQNVTIIYAITLTGIMEMFNPLKPELNPICYLLALLGSRHFLHVSRIRVKLLTLGY